MKPVRGNLTDDEELPPPVMWHTPFPTHLKAVFTSHATWQERSEKTDLFRTVYSISFLHIVNGVIPFDVVEESSFRNGLKA